MYKIAKYILPSIKIAKKLPCIEFQMYPVDLYDKKLCKWQFNYITEKRNTDTFKLSYRNESHIKQ